MNNKRLLNRKQAAEYLATSPACLAVAASRKTLPIPVVKMGRAVRYDIEDLNRYIEENKKPILKPVCLERDDN